MKTKPEIMAELSAARNQIPNLNVSPTRDNMTILLFIMQSIDDAVAFVHATPDVEPVEGAADDA